MKTNEIINCPYCGKPAKDDNDAGVTVTRRKEKQYFHKSCVVGKSYSDSLKVR